tara:strand:- start:21 stop:263 length:243 start_codon:yes stop_codon:yes gene_type:complete
MPLYTYYCNVCKEEVDYKHKMSVVLEDCEICQTKGSLNKAVGRIGHKTGVKTRIGDVVKDSIKNAREEIIKDKEKYRKEL